MYDALRPGIDTSIQLLKYGKVISDSEKESDAKQQVKVRLISGDMKATCSWVAIQTGIITHDESLKPGVIMTGE
jgi:hypothetical protein